MERVKTSSEIAAEPLAVAEIATPHRAVVATCDRPDTRLLSRPDVVNTASLYCTTAANYLVPLLVTPLFARRLGPSGFGQATAGLALAASVGMLVDYGFPFSGTRLVAQHQEDREVVTSIVSSIQGAKLLLTVAIVGVCIPIWWLLPLPLGRGEGKVLLFGLVSGLARGLLPLYYFQGINRLAYPAALTSILRGLGMVAVIPFVRTPAGAGILVAGDAVASLLNLIFLTHGLYRVMAWRCPSVCQSLKAIRESSSLFVFSLLSSTYATFGILAARSLAPYSEIGLFGGADKISRAATSAFGPIGQVAYPKISRMIHSGAGDARKAARWSFWLNVAIGIFLFVTVFFGARLIVAILLGPSYWSAVTVLRILSFQLLATSISRAAGIQWMLPLGLDGLMTKLIAASVVAYFLLLWVLVPRFGAVGMAVAFVVAECQLAGTMILTLHRLRLSWWQDPCLISPGR